MFHTVSPWFSLFGKPFGWWCFVLFCFVCFVLFVLGCVLCLFCLKGSPRCRDVVVSSRPPDRQSCNGARGSGEKKNWCFNQQCDPSGRDSATLTLIENLFGDPTFSFKDHPGENNFFESIQLFRDRSIYRSNRNKLLTRGP